jgi:hypothetical protein
MAETLYDTSKKHIDELVNKYKKNRTIANTDRAGTKTLKGKYVLEVPKQKAGIPQEVLDYAKQKQVIIREIENITDEMLKFW